MGGIATRLSRRNALAGLLGTVAFGIGSPRFSTAALAQQLRDIHQLKPGQFVWHPERAPDGPVSIIVSLPDQLVHVYRNGVRIGVSTCSTGKPGHGTPTGVFTILEKDQHHHSSTYDNASMPNMNRLTWSGIALHAGNLPGYPASHGCIRLPMKFSELLFAVTHVGTPVIIAGTASEPRDIIHPGLALTPDAVKELDSKKSERMKATKSPWQADVVDFSKPAAVVISSADMSAIVFEDGEIVAQDTITLRDPDMPLGSHVFVLKDAGDGRMTWQTVSYQAQAEVSDVPMETSVLQRISLGHTAFDAFHERTHSGLVVVTTDLPSHPDTRSGKDFVIMS